LTGDECSTIFEFDWWPGVRRQAGQAAMSGAIGLTRQQSHGFIPSNAIVLLLM
jgi:hypothetical protein